MLQCTFVMMHNGVEDKENGGRMSRLPQSRKSQDLQGYNLREKREEERDKPRRVSMLTGRESLKRVIGKRRIFLPNRQSILASSLPQSSLVKEEEQSDGSGPAVNVPEPINLNGGSEWISCPVCNSKISGGDDAINSHLDTCLARGSKRKLSQKTLFQLNFSSRSKAKTCPSEADNSVITDSFTKNSEQTILSESFDESSDWGTHKEGRSTESHLPFASVGLKDNPLPVSFGRTISNHEINNEDDLPLLPSDRVMFRHGIRTETDDELLEMSLQTFIVGRRFANATNVEPGAKIFLLRDPYNPKDSNAMKVIAADCGSGEVLGFLPREVGQYVSPLVDKFTLCFEGCVASVSKHTLASIPVQISCANKLGSFEEYTESSESLKCLWRHAQNAAESAKSSSSGTQKYQRNLVLLIQEVLRSCSHLFSDSEKTCLETFTSLSDDSQRLFARLYMRKGPWFRLSNISYPEIYDCGSAIEELMSAGYICSLEATADLQEDGISEVLNVLNVPELQDMANSICAKKKTKKVPGGMKKRDLIGCLLSSYKSGACSNLTSLILGKTSSCVRLTVSAASLMWRVERLFFLNGEQDLSAFLLVDLGIVKYPSYNCIQADQIFQSRSDLLSYEEAIEVAQLMDEFLDENKSDLVKKCVEIAAFRMSSNLGAVQSTATHLSCFQSSWVYSKVVLLGISFFEREQSYGNAIKLLKRLLETFTSDGRRGYWSLRLSIDLEHKGYIDDSLQVAEDALLDPWVRAGPRVALQKRVLRLGKPPRRWRVPSYAKSVKRKIPEVNIQGRPVNSEMGMRSIFYNEDGEQCGVEQLALHYYAGEGGAWKGVHTESGIWLTIFALLMWDIVFADVPNAFCTRFQTAPLDLETDRFYVIRKDLIEPQLQKIEGGIGEEILLAAWQSHVGTMCRGVNWEKHSLSELRAAVSCIGGPCLASICRNLAQDYRSWSSGMPDLLLWRFHDDHRGEAKLVEVKGPRDRLSEQQRAWLLFLLDCGLNVEVCKVTPPV